MNQNDNAVTLATDGAPSNQKLAWGRIRERIEQAIIAVQDAPYVNHWLFGPMPPSPQGFKSILDEVQSEYKAGRITEPERDAMRKHVKFWLGDPDAYRPLSRFDGPYIKSYDTYACGLWAASAAPDGEVEYNIILSTLVILEEESE